jgi:hypothetical protein
LIGRGTTTNFWKTGGINRHRTGNRANPVRMLRTLAGKIA